MVLARRRLASGACPYCHCAHRTRAGGRFCGICVETPSGREGFRRAYSGAWGYSRSGGWVGGGRNRRCLARTGEQCSQSGCRSIDLALTYSAASKRSSAASRRSVTVLGSTGSIGCSTIDLVARNRENFDLAAITAHSNVEALAAQAREHRPRLAVIGQEGHYAALKGALAGTGIEVATGAQAVVEAAERPSDWVMAGIVGVAGLAPTLSAVRRGACVALANKECLVSAGSLFLAEV